MPTERLFAMRAQDARVYVATTLDPRAHAEASGGNVILETKVQNPARAVEYVHDALYIWSLGDGWFRPGVRQEVLVALFGTAQTFPASPPEPKPDAIDAALRAELTVQEPPPEVKEALEVQEVSEVEPAPPPQNADEPDATAARLERRRRAIEAGLIRP